MQPQNRILDNCIIIRCYSPSVLLVYILTLLTVLTCRLIPFFRRFSHPTWFVEKIDLHWFRAAEEGCNMQTISAAQSGSFTPNWLQWLNFYFITSVYRYVRLLLLPQGETYSGKVSKEGNITKRGEEEEVAANSGCRGRIVIGVIYCSSPHWCHHSAHGKVKQKFTHTSPLTKSRIRMLGGIMSGNANLGRQTHVY